MIIYVFTYDNGKIKVELAVHPTKGRFISQMILVPKNTFATFVPKNISPPKTSATVNPA